MSRRRDRGDDGVAALEFAMISLVLLFLAFAALPLFTLARSYEKTNNSSADTLRYASSLDANAHSTTTSAGTVAISRRPTRDDVTRFAQAAANDSKLVVTVVVYPAGSTTPRTFIDSTYPIEAESGDKVVVTVAESVDLSLLGSLANGLGSLFGSGNIVPHGVVTMSSTSTGREE
ncbi:MAG: hypothetical protein JWM40_929 [Frankiales bacterium]|nr:hypothetical protein [Frankiales bacterium]